MKAIQPATERSLPETTLDLLRRFESRNVTYIEPDGSWPIVWERAKGTHVWDADGKRYLDLTAAFGVAAAGHRNSRVVRAGQEQMDRLLHAMGDVHPHRLKAELARELSRMTFERWSRQKMRSGHTLSRLTGKTIFCNSGFEAVEAALKTALLATGKEGVIAFKRAYHGLGYGALAVTHRKLFRQPFRRQLCEFGQFIDFPETTNALARTRKELKSILRRQRIGAILTEPIQGRGGIHVPPPEFLPMLREMCDRHQILLVLDEIYTGFGRTGRWFACEHSKARPDIICLGKALTGGFPLSACVGRADLMDASWPPSTGEAIHTSTYLGHPVGCAMALAQIQEIKRAGLIEASASKGSFLLKQLAAIRPPEGLTLTTRGIGLMAGIELCLANGAPATSLALEIVKSMLRRGVIVLPEGEHGNVIGFSPPLTISNAQLAKATGALDDALAELGGSTSRTRRAL